MGLTIDGKKLEVPDGITLLDAIRQAGLDVPTLCTLEGLKNIGVCRMCVVEVEKARALVPACSTPVGQGMVVWTESPRVQNARRTVLEMMASEHKFDCMNCPRNSNCELQRLAFAMDTDDLLVRYHERAIEPDFTNKAVVIDYNRCILCGRCIRSCSEIQTVNAIDYSFRGYSTVVGSPLGEGLANSTCVSCGLCTLNCPVASIQEHSSFEDLGKDIQIPLPVSPIIDPLSLITISEEFWAHPGQSWMKDLEAFLTKLGMSSPLVSFDGFDLSIIEEANELVKALSSEKKIVVSRACPAAVEFVRKLLPERMSLLSRANGPQFALASLIRDGVFEKTYGVKRNSRIASISYCLANKSELWSPAYEGRLVNYVVSVRELARLARAKGNEDLRLAEISEFKASPSLLDTVSGGRAELVMRTAARLLGEKIVEDSLKPLRAEGEDKSTTVTLGGCEVKVLAANTLRACRRLLDNLNLSSPAYVELMACPNGCVGGGGQPIPSSEEVRQLRSQAVLKLYENLGKATPWDSIWSRTLYKKANERGLTRLEGDQ